MVGLALSSVIQTARFSSQVSSEEYVFVFWAYW